MCLHRTNCAKLLFEYRIKIIMYAIYVQREREREREFGLNAKCKALAARSIMSMSEESGSYGWWVYRFEWIRYIFSDLFLIYESEKNKLLILWEGNLSMRERTERNLVRRINVVLCQRL